MFEEIVFFEDPFLSGIIVSVFEVADSGYLGDHLGKPVDNPDSSGEVGKP
jgi:hypothetical protein